MFSNLIGNNLAKDTLRRMIEARRVPGALLFVGPDGVGKKLFALEVAKAMLCGKPVDLEACDVCSSCIRVGKFVLPASDDKEPHKKVIRSEHTDVGLVTAYGNTIYIEAVRDLEREANFRPYEGVARFFIIESAEKLIGPKDSAANALLKTLEEPPATSHIFLITSRLSALLPTIRSRCQVVRFAPVAAEDIEKHLLKDAKLTQRDARLFARVSEGSVGRALSLDMQLYKGQREAMLKVLESLALTKDRARLLRSSEELNDAKIKDEYVTRLDVLQTLIHDVWALSLKADEEKIVNEDLKEELKRFSLEISSRRVAGWLIQIERLREQLTVNINRKIATDALFLSMVKS